MLLPCVFYLHHTALLTSTESCLYLQHGCNGGCGVFPQSIPRPWLLHSLSTHTHAHTAVEPECLRLFLPGCLIHVEKYSISTWRGAHLIYWDVPQDLARLPPPTYCTLGFRDKNTLLFNFSVIHERHI